MSAKTIDVLGAIRLARHHAKLNAMCGGCKEDRRAWDAHAEDLDVALDAVRELVEAASLAREMIDGLNSAYGAAKPDSVARRLEAALANFKVMS